MSTAGIEILHPREDGTRICGKGVPLTPVGEGGLLTNMGRLVALLDARLEDLLTFTTGTPGVDEVQTVAINGGPTNGSMFLTIPGIGGPTAAIPANASGGQVQAALTAIPEVTEGDVLVSLLGGTYTCSFQNNLAQQPIQLMTATHTFNKGGVTIAEQTAGAAPGAGISAKSTVDESGGLLLTVKDSTGQSWTYRVIPAFNADSTMITFLGELGIGEPNAAPAAPFSYPATEMEWRESTVKYQVPKGTPEPDHLGGLQVLGKRQD